MAVKTWDIPSYTVRCDGVSCGHDHTDIDAAERCARTTMAKGKVPLATVYQNHPHHERTVRRVIRLED